MLGGGLGRENGVGGRDTQHSETKGCVTLGPQVPGTRETVRLAQSEMGRGDWKRQSPSPPGAQSPHL